VNVCRVGFVGADGVAARHADTLADFPDVNLVAVMDTDPDRAQSFARRFGVRTAPDVDRLVETGVDAVYVCVPPFAHGPAEEAVAAAGLGLFVEKPLGLNCEVPERVAEAVAAAGVVSAVGHHWRYSASVATARRLLRNLPVRLVVGAWLDQPPPAAWWAVRGHSGGQVVKQAIHILDLARLFAGEVTEVCAVANENPPVAPDADVDEATAATLRFADGAVGSLAATCLLGWKHRAGLEVYADNLALTLTEDGIDVRGGRGCRQWQPVDPAVARRAADRAFIDALLSKGDDIRVPYPEALRTHRLACAVAQSAAEHRSVALELQPVADLVGEGPRGREPRMKEPRGYW
jgi:predicted dehydrogenase